MTRLCNVLMDLKPETGYTSFVLHCVVCCQLIVSLEVEKVSSHTLLYAVVHLMFDLRAIYVKKGDVT